MKDANMNERQLAEASGVDITLIRRYLKKQVNIGLDNAPRLAKALRCDPGLLVFGGAA
jgi:transcriptional regulator with XRE-family HTH domain